MFSIEIPSFYFAEIQYSAEWKERNFLSFFFLHAHLICLGNLKVMHINRYPINEMLLSLLHLLMDATFAIYTAK